MKELKDKQKSDKADIYQSNPSRFGYYSRTMNMERLAENGYVEEEITYTSSTRDSLELHFLNGWKQKTA